MLRKMKNITAAICSLALTAGGLPVIAPTGAALAAEEAEVEPAAGDVVFSEDFEDGNIGDIIRNQQRGFSIAGASRYTVDVGSGFGTGSGAVRFCNLDWGGTNSLTLDLVKSAEEQGYGDFAEAAQGNIALSVKMMMDADYGGFWNGGTNTLIVENQSGQGVLGLEAYTKDNGQDDITLNLIALNEAGNENIRYELARGRDNVFKLTKDLMIYFDTENKTYQIRINNNIISAGSHGEWIPMSTSGLPGKASKAGGFKLGRVKIDNQGSNWYGGIVLDDIKALLWTKLKFTGEAAAPGKAMTMWYRKPADKWAESMPLGNGRIGAMVWGRVTKDTLSLNEVTTWSGEDHRDLNLDRDGSVDGYADLNALREELKKDSPNSDKIHEYVNKIKGTDNPVFGTNRPFGTLDFDFSGIGDTVSDYRRSLDLQDAVSTVEFTADGTKYTREALVSNPDQVIAMKYSADKTGKISFNVNYGVEEPNGADITVTPESDCLVLDGAVHNNDNVKNGVKMFAYMKAIPTNGTVTYDKDGIHVQNADDAVLIVSLGTDFKANESYKQNTKENCKAQFDAALAKGYESIKADHISDVKKLYDRMTIEIGSKADLKSDEPTDVRLEKIREGGDLDGSFMSLWYQYARYLMIAGSRENSPLPMNLLGIWNDNVACNMSWTCDYHIDMNIQMNQWMSNSANLSEAEKPIFDFMKNILIPNGNVTAKKQYNSPNGWLAGYATNAWGDSAMNNFGDWDAFRGTACGGWLAQEIMNYYSYTGDKQFLEDDGFDMLKGAAEFYNDFMTQYTDNDGNTYWVTIPSTSPEHGYVEMMSTIDITVISDIFEQTLKCYDILNKEHDAFYESIKSKLENLAPYKIAQTGNLAEWPFTVHTDDGNTNHRHTSHLLGLFPYAQITPDKTPELAKAALVSMHRRFDRSDFEHTEWTAINAAGQFARLKDGENAYKFLKLEGDTFTWPNLFSFSPEGIALAPCDIFAIDGTFGVGKVAEEMLLQSHSDRLEFLPALPKQWSEGNIEGMSAEGAFEVDFKWKDYTIESAAIHSKSGNRVNILKNAAINWDNVAVYDEDNNQVTVENTSKLLSFDTEKGKSYTLKNKYGEKLRTGRIINDSDPRIKYTNFSYHNGRELPDVGNDIHYSQNKDAAIEFQFTGTGIDVLAEGTTGSKQMEVFIDGESKGKYKANAASDNDRAGQKVLYSVDDLKFGNHTIKLVQTEDGGYFEFDAFAVRGQYFSFINDDNPIITYSDGWGRNEGRNVGNFDYMGDVHYATENGKNLTIDFEGTGIETVLEKNSGVVEIKVDNVSYGEINVGELAGSSTDRRITVSEISGLANGSHTLTLTKTGGDWCIVDGFVILKDGAGAGLNPGTYEISGLTGSRRLSGGNSTISLTSSMSGADNQKWYFDYIDGRAFRLINAQSGMAASISAGDNRSLVQEPVDETNKRQLWQKLPYTLDNGEFQIMNCAIAQFAQIDGGHTGNGGGVALWTYENSDHTRWTVEDAGDGFVFVRNAVGTYLQVDPNGITSSGAGIKTWEKLAGGDQLWKITASGSDRYIISNAVTGEAVVSNNGKVSLTANADAENALWTAEERKSNGTAYYMFTNVSDDTVLAVESENGWRLSPKTEVSSSPAAENIKISGNINVGETLRVAYDYKSSDNKPEGTSTYNVYLLSDKYQKAQNPIASGNAAGGFNIIVPDGYTRSSIIAVEIMPKAADGAGNGRFFAYVTAPNTDNTSMSANITGEKIFTENDLGAIRYANDGWSFAGGTIDSDYTLSVTEKDGVSNVLSIAPTDWWKDGKIRLNLDGAGIGSVAGNGYFEFDAMFDAPNYFDRESRMLVALNNGTTDFAAVRLMGRRLDIIALTEDGAFRQLYTIGLGMEELYGKWMNFKLYTNGSDSFAVAVDDEFVRNQNGGIWFKASQNACDNPNTASAARTDKIDSVKLGFEWAGKDSALRIANMRFGTYSAAAVNGWIITSMEPENGELIFGEENNIETTVVETEAVPEGVLITGLYRDGRLIQAKITRDLVFDSQGVSRTTASLYVPEQGGDYALKGFVWNSAGGMTPVGGAFTRRLSVESAFKVPNVFSDNMMLQADKPITVWGEALDGRTVTAVLLNDDTEEEFTAETVSDGEFSLELPAQEAGGNYTLSVTCGSETRTYKNIIFGDVYLLAGQSNMEYWMSGLADTNADLKANPDRAENPNIRSVDLLSKGTDGASVPQENFPSVSGTMWKPMTYSNAQSASQIGYYFAQQLNEEIERPIGFIGAAVGGTGSDRWIKNGKLYNNRVYPARNFKIAGILYYQGEADEGKTAEQYSDIMAGIIDDYRELFDNEDLPFYYAQLARYSNQKFEEIRAGQVLALQKIANDNNVGIVSNLDEVGNYGANGNTSGNARHDIHPYGKAEVARRFALYAKRDIYGEEVIASGPVYKSMEQNGSTLELTFDCTGELKIMDVDQYGDYKTAQLISSGELKPDILNGFEIAGEDGVYYTAEAVIEGNKVLLTSPEVSQPVSVRYAWGAYPESPNLTDDTDLPSYTFKAAL